MKPDVIVVSNKSKLELAPLVCDLEGFTQGHRVVWTCQDASAAENRNDGLRQAQGDIVVMIDDDISGFYDGWIEDLIEPLEQDPSVVYVSANLTNRDGSPGPMMFRGNPAERWTRVPRAPTACIAFRNDGVTFDERFVGSGFEDDAFCCEMLERFPYGKFVVANHCRIVHDNEQKNQGGKNFEMNKAHFEATYRRDGRYGGIPTILHWIWLGPVPEHVPVILEMWKNLNPNFKVMEHREDVLLPQFEHLYKRLHGEHLPERKSDLLRLSALKRYGGWYFDCDFIPLQPISELAPKPRNGMMVVRRHETLIANGFIAAQPDSIALQDWISYILKIYRERGEKLLTDWGALGPAAATDLWQYQNNPKPAILDPALFFPYGEDEKGITQVKEFYQHIKAGESIPHLKDCFAVHMHMKGGTLDELERNNGEHWPWRKAGDSGLSGLR